VSLKIDPPTIEEREVAYKGKILSCICIIMNCYAGSQKKDCGFLGEIQIQIGNIEVARKLQPEFAKLGKGGDAR